MTAQAGDSSHTSLIAALSRGEPVLVPTATGYAIAVNPFDARGVEKVFELKQRPPGMALLLLCKDGAQAKSLVEPPDGCRFNTLAHLFWPGSLTMVMPAADPRLAPGVVAPDGTVAVRVDSDPVLAELLAQLEFPLTGTSANLHGRPTPSTVAEALGQIPGLVALDGGERPAATPSTIIALEEHSYRLLRGGAVSFTALEQAFSGRCC